MGVCPTLDSVQDTLRQSHMALENGWTWSKFLDKKSHVSLYGLLWIARNRWSNDQRVICEAQWTSSWPFSNPRGHRLEGPAWKRSSRPPEPLRHGRRTPHGCHQTWGLTMDFSQHAELLKVTYPSVQLPRPSLRLPNWSAHLGEQRCSTAMHVK